jgi:Protein of unknown function (DUF3276)
MVRKQGDLPKATAKVSKVSKSTSKSVKASGKTESSAKAVEVVSKVPPKVTAVKTVPTKPSDGGRSLTLGPDEVVLFQKFFKSVSPRTYTVQVKRVATGNHCIVLAEDKRDSETNEVKRHRLHIYSEDFGQFFRLLQETVNFVKTHPVPDEIKKKRERFWAKRAEESAGGDDIEPPPIPTKVRVRPK